MSAIYGIYKLPAVNFSISGYLAKAGAWNLAYGQEPAAELSLTDIGMGICPEHLTLSPRNEHPIIQNEKYLAVVDAVIYNRRELLDKYSLEAGLSDEEIVFQRATARQCPEKADMSDINGDFCAAIYDKGGHKLCLLRDHLGVRPLFYYKSDSLIAFSTDPRGLIAEEGLDININPEWLYRKAKGFDSSDYTATEFDRIFQVTPTGVVSFEAKNDTIVSSEHIYWELGKHKIHKKSRKAYAEELKKIISDAVKVRADVFPGRLGAELSGGLDSGVIDILLNKLGREGAYYSWSYSPEDLPIVPNDERSVIADICEQEGIECIYGESSYDLGPDCNMAKKLANIGFKPQFDRESFYCYALPSYINTLIICDTAKTVSDRGCSVVFSGHGGDEGVSHRTNHLELLYHKEYLHFLAHHLRCRKGQKHRFIRTARAFMPALRDCDKRSKEVFRTGFDAGRIMKPDFLSKFNEKDMPVLMFTFDAVKYIHSGNTHVRPDVAALLGAYSGARYVFPFLDYRAVDYAVSIPRYLYLNGQQNRAVYREAFRDIMPESLYNCVAKDNPSEQGLYDKREDNWYEGFSKYKEILWSEINRDYWSEYLDMDEVEKWHKASKPSKEEEKECFEIATLLQTCLSFQHMLEAVRAHSAEKNPA